MPAIWKPQSQLVYMDWVKTIKTAQASLNSYARQNGEGLNDWERKFVDSIHSVLLMKKDLTHAQASKLEQIYNKHT